MFSSVFQLMSALKTGAVALSRLSVVASKVEQAQSIPISRSGGGV